MDRNSPIFRHNSYSHQFNPVIPRPSVDLTASVAAIASQPRSMSQSSATLSQPPLAGESREFDRRAHYGRQRQPSEPDGVIYGRWNSEYLTQHPSSHIASQHYNISATGAQPRSLGPEIPVLDHATARPTTRYPRRFEASLEDYHRKAALESGRSRNDSLASTTTDGSIFDPEINELETQFRNAPDIEEYEEEEEEYDNQDDEDEEDEEDEENEEPPSTPHASRHRRPSSASVSSQRSIHTHSRSSTPRAHTPAYTPHLAGIHEGSLGSVSSAPGASFYASQYPSTPSGGRGLKASPSSDRILTRAMEKALREGTWDGRGPFCSPTSSPSRAERAMPYGRVAFQKDAAPASSASPKSRRR